MNRKSVGAPYLAVLLVGIFTNAGVASANSPRPRDTDPTENLGKYCVSCHGPEKQKGGVRLDDLSADFSVVSNSELWTRVLDQLNGGLMPPKGKRPLSPREFDDLTTWIADQLRRAEGDRSEARLRRLSRFEYTRTIEDLLGILFTTPDDFPPDPSDHGFDNNPNALSISPDHLEKYLAVAEESLDVALGFRHRPPGSTRIHVFDVDQDPWRHAFGRHPWDVKGRKLTRAILTPGQSGDMATNYWHTGVQTIRASVAAIPGGRYPFPPRLVVTINQRRTLDVAVTGTLDAPQHVEFRYFDRGDNLRFEMSNGVLLPTGEGHGQPHKLNNKEINEYRSTVPCLVVDHIEIDGNDVEPWPPSSRGRILFQGESAPKTRDYAREIVGRFMGRAYRRPVEKGEVDRIFGLVEKELGRGEAFEVAIKYGLRAVLCSPHFLFLAEAGGPEGSRQLTGRELASRLSYYLWSSLPDDELVRLADDGSLGRPETLRMQVDRMLAAPRSDALVEKFCSGWLELAKVGRFTPDRFAFPNYETTLESAMVGETKAFFRFILRGDLDVADFLRSDWAALNERMARHYGIPGVSHDDFRMVKLPENSRRGGLLTQASILCLTSDGTRTKPVNRGKWVLENILGTPPPPPPPNAGQLPNIPEFSRLPIREQLRRHREIESCAGCHAKIDPIGFVLEQYDAIGSWRETEVVADPTLPKHTVTGYEPESVLIEWAHAGKTLPIDATGNLPDGTRIEGVSGLQSILMKRQDDFLRSLSEKMFGYALGRGLRFGDRPAVDELSKHLAERRTLRSLIQEIVTTAAFQSK